MAKAVVYTLLTAAFIVILIRGHLHHRHHGHGQLRALNRRLGDKFRSPAFDPLVAKMERRREERESSEEGHGETNLPAAGEAVADESKFLGREGRLNISLRLVVLFPLMDKAPADGVVSPAELNSWLGDMAVDRLNYRTRRVLSSHDRDIDRAVSFSEYLPQFSEEDLERNDTSHGEAGWWKQQFVNADVDRNGVLSFDELKDFLHPEDSDNEEIKKWLLRGKIESMDNDKDGKLNFVEFSEHAYGIYKNYFEYETTGSQIPSAEDKFLELDLNKDKTLDVEELIPILNYLSPGELSYAKFYAGYLIQEADDNKDGNLSLDEMLSHEYIFYSTVYDDNNDGSDEDYHDEL